MLKRLLHALLVAVVGVTIGVVALPTQAQAAEPTVYTQPGVHLVNGRYWNTECEMYSSDVVRCRTEIWATSYVKQGGRYHNHNSWVFNNLTYLPSSRASWGANPLANTGPWTDANGRQWRTECDTATTGRNGCRTYTVSSVVALENGRNVVKDIEVLNNMISFSTSTIPAVTTIPAAAPPLEGAPVDAPFTPPSASGAVKSCKASFYGGYWHGRLTANGEIFDTYSMTTAANPKLPWNTMLEVTNKANGKSVVVRVNNYGPFVSGRCLDLSTAAMEALDGVKTGVIDVEYRIVS